MFKLQLTDGEQEISAIEYEPIRSLNSDIPIQSKLFVKGPVTCRRGCLLLTEQSIQLLHCPAQNTQLVQETNTTVENNIVTPDHTPRSVGVEERPRQDIVTTRDQPEPSHHRTQQQQATLAEPILHNKRPLPDTTHNPEKRHKLDYEDDDAFMLEDEDYLREIEADLDNRPSVVSGEPCVFLKQIAELPERERAGSVFTVKALIVKLLEKLSVGRDGWSLKCTIADGTHTLDVRFTSHVFSQLIGLTPEHMNALKKDMASKPELKQEAVQALQKAKETLQVLYCLIEITFMDEPMITKLTPFHHSHAQLLMKRNCIV